MTTAFAIALADEIIQRLEAMAVLQAINFHADKVQEAGGTLKAFCPIHQDSRFRSLLVDADRRAFRCTIKTCRGYGGGSLLELYALARDIQPLQAAYELVDRLQIDLGPDWQSQLAESYLAETSAATDRGDYTEAETLLRELISVMPDLPDARILLASVMAELGNPEAAAEEYVRLIEKFLADGRLEDASPAAEDAIRRFPDNEDLLFIRVRVAELKDESELAISRMQEIVELREASNREMDNIGLLEQLVSKVPERTDYALKLAALYEQQHNLRGASRQYENAAKELLKAGDKAEAIELLEKVLQFNGENTRARLDLARQLAEVGEVDRARVHTFRAINQQIDQQEFGLAVTTINAWVEREPDSVESREMLARVFQEQARVPEAAAYLAEGAQIASRLSDHTRAADLLLRAKFLLPDDTDLRRQLIAEFASTNEQQRAAFEIIDLAEILFGADQGVSASELLINSASMDVSLQLKLQMVSSLAGHGVSEAALQIINGLAENLTSESSADEVAEVKAMQVQLQPADVNHRLDFIQALWQVSAARAAEAAVEATEFFLARDSSLFEATQVLEKITELLDSYVPATGHLLELAERCDRLDLAGAIYQVSIQGFAEQDAESALKAARRIAELDPGHPSAPSDIAFLLGMLGRADEAATQYAEVAELLRVSGDLENALQYAREGAALNPNNVLALASQALLARDLLSPEEMAEYAVMLLSATRDSTDAVDVTRGYVAYSELYPDDLDILKEAADRLKALDWAEGMARMQARQAAHLAEAGNLAEARALLEDAVLAAPDVPEIIDQFGQTALALGDADAAAGALARAASIYKGLGYVDAATRCATQAYEAGPVSLQNWELLFRGAEAAGLSPIAAQASETLTRAYSESGPQSTAARWAREWVRLAPDNACAYEFLASALLTIDQKDSSSHAFSTAARIYSQSGNPQGALSILRRAADAGLFTAENYSILSELEAQLPDGGLKTEARVLSAEIAVSGGNLSDACAIAEKLDAEPEAARVWSRIAKAETEPGAAQQAYLNAARILQQYGSDDDAVTELQAAVALGSAEYEVKQLLATLLDEAKRYDEALPWQLAVVTELATQNSVELQPLLTHLRQVYADSVDGLTSLGKTLHGAGLPSEAITDLEAAATLASKSNNAAALVAICSVDETLTRGSMVLTRARADSLMGMENEQQALEWVRSTGRELLKAGKAREAVEMAQKWISLARDDREAYRLYADACEAAGDADCAFEARLSLVRFIFEAGDLVDALREIEPLADKRPSGISALRLKADIEKGLKEADSAATTLVLLGDAYLEAGEEGSALSVLQESVALQPANAAALRRLADVTKSAQGLVAAQPLYRQWIAAAKESAEPAQLVQMLEELRTIAPDSVWVLRELTNSLIAQSRAIEAAPHLSHLSFVLETEGDYRAAAQALELAASHAAVADPEQLVAIAELYEKASSPASAQEQLRHASALLLDAGKPADAAQLLDKVLKLSGDDILPEDYAIAAKANVVAGNVDLADTYLRKALGSISRVSGNRPRRESLLTQALEINPLNVDYILQHMELLPPNRAMTEGLRKARELSGVDRPDDAIRVLSQVIILAPHDMSIRQELFAPLRQTGNTNRLLQELMAVAADAVAAGDTDAAVEALDEAAVLAQSAAHYRSLAELNERARRTDIAAANFAAAALAFAQEGKVEPAVANINRAISAKPSSVPAESMAQLVELVGLPVLDVAREQLRSALTARRQKQSQVLALALLEAIDLERRADILKTVNSLGGSTFAVGISQRWTQHLLDKKDMAGALHHAASLIEISPDSPDAWQLAAKVYLAVDMPADARRCAVEAARLYQTAGAVIEEEDSYRLALQAEPDNVTVKAALAEYYIREHREDEAVDLLKQLIMDAEAAGNSDLLLEYLNRAVQAAPANTDMREKLASELEKFAPDSAIENWLEAAQIYLQQNELDRAVRVYRHVLKLNPGNETALQELLTQAEQAGDLVSAAKYTSALATLKASRKNVGEACRLLQNYLEIDADNLAILEQLASLSGTSNNAEVFAATTKALGQKHQKAGNYSEAIYHYEHLLERTPKDARLLTSLLDCSAAAGLQEQGALYARRLLSLARETEDPERVRLAATTILNYDESDAVARNDLGEALLSLNRVQEAVAEWMRAAELFEESGNTAAAYTCYRRVTQVNPGTLQAWKRMADLALSLGDTESGKVALLQVLDKISDSREAQKLSPQVARLLQSLPEDPQVHEAALKHYNRIEASDKAIQEYIWLAEKAVQAGEEQQAEALLDEALKTTPNDLHLKKVRYDLIRKMGRLEELQLRLRTEAESYEASGDTAQAVSVLQELLNAAPGQIAIHRDLARLLESSGKFEEALGQQLEVIRLQLQKGELEEAREIANDLAENHKKDSRARERIADLLASSPFPDVAARHYMAAAQIAESTQDIERAVSLYAKAAQARPAWAEARSSLAAACEAAGNSEMAFEAWIALTAILLDEGNFAEATATLDQLAKIRPESPEVRLQLAALYEKTGKREQQAAVLQELVALYEGSDNNEQALEMYRKLVAISPDDPTLFTRYVELLSLQGANAEDLAEEYARLAEVLARSGDYQAAMQTYEQVVGVNPENTAARSRYAAFLLGRGSRNRALTEMRALANLYMDRGEPVAAVEVLNAALTIAPRDADLCLALATAQEAAGLTEEARVSYARASAILASTAAVKGIDTYRRILSQDEQNTAVRLRLVELLLNSGDTNEAAREARTLAEIHIGRGELVEAEKAYRLVDQCEPESIDEIQAAVKRDSYDPSLQYVHYVRLGNVLTDCGDIDKALDAYRTARSLHDDQPEIIQKCIDCVSLIAPEAEAIPDYLLMAEKLLLAGDMHHARQTYEKVRLIDPFNNDAKCGIESVNAAERARSKSAPGNDDMILKTTRAVSKRVALRDLVAACQEAAQDQRSSDSQRLGG